MEKSESKDKGGTVHIDAETMKKIEEYQQFLKDKHPEMPIPTKGQIDLSLSFWTGFFGFVRFVGV